MSNALALNLVTQLYGMGAIEAARPPGAKKPTDEVSLRGHQNGRVVAESFLSHCVSVAAPG